MSKPSDSSLGPAPKDLPVPAVASRPKRRYLKNSQIGINWFFYFPALTIFLASPLTPVYDQLRGQRICVSVPSAPSARTNLLLDNSPTATTSLSTTYSLSIRSGRDQYLYGLYVNKDQYKY